MGRMSPARVLSRGRGRALTYRSAPHHLDPQATDAAGQRLARNPLPRATRARALAASSFHSLEERIDDAEGNL